MTIRRLIRARLLLGAVVVLATTSLTQAFTTNPAGGRLVAQGGQSPVAVSDAAGGAIVAWRDVATGSVVLNRFDSSARPLWDQGMSYQAGHGVQLVSDGAGGAIVAEQSGETPALVVRRYQADGASLWQSNVGFGTLVGDGAGGAWILRASGDVLAERVVANGSTPGVVALTAGSPGVSWPSGAPDGAGGAYIAWRQGDVLRMNHVRPDGSLAWGTGITVAPISGAIAGLLLASGGDGVVVGWHRQRVLDIAAIGPDGAVRWTAGVPTRGGSRIAAITSDRAGGAYVLWNVHDAEGTNDTISAARFSAQGRRAWTVLLGATQEGASALRLASDDTGMVAGWEIAGAPLLGSNDTDLYAQRLSREGVRAWRDERVATSLGPDAFGEIVAGADGSAVAVFTQSPCLISDFTGVAMQRIDASGARASSADGGCPSIPTLPSIPSIPSIPASPVTLPA
jgi:hypothetical protein